MGELKLTDKEREFFQRFADLCCEFNAMFWEEDFRLSLMKENTFDLHISGSVFDGMGNIKETRLNIRKVDARIAEIKSLV